MFMPAGCHLGSWRASAALNEPLRSEPTIEITFTLSAMFQILEVSRPASRSLTRVPRIGEAPALQAPLAAKAMPLKPHHAHVTDAATVEDEMAGNTQKIGWIGMGRMGFPMAERLLKAGHDVSIWNRTRAKAEPLAKSGGRIVDKLS